MKLTQKQNNKDSIFKTKAREMAESAVWNLNYNTVKYQLDRENDPQEIDRLKLKLLELEEERAVRQEMKEEQCFGDIVVESSPDDNHQGEPWYSWCRECEAEDYILSKPHIKDKRW